MVLADDRSLEVVKKGLTARSLFFDDRQSTIEIEDHNAARIW
jgi:hypothetical protein